MLIRIIIPAFLCFNLFFFISCSDTSTSNSGTGIILSDTGDFKYPLKPGSSWSFQRTIEADDIRPDSILHYFSNYPLITNGSASVLYDTVINGINTTCLLETYISRQYTSVSRQYVINTDSAYILYASRNNSYFITYLKPVFKTKYGLNADNTHPEEEIRIFDPPYEILKYPVVTGKEWIAYKYTGLIREVQKKYLGWKSLQIQTNQVQCMETRCIISISPETPFYNYYSKFGLLKRYVFLDDILVTNEIHPEGMGYADITDTYLVTSFNIP
jgi:hypothetical protein